MNARQEVEEEKNSSLLELAEARTGTCHCNSTYNMHQSRLIFSEIIVYLEFQSYYCKVTVIRKNLCEPPKFTAGKIYRRVLCSYLARMTYLYFFLGWITPSYSDGAKMYIHDTYIARQYKLPREGSLRLTIIQTHTERDVVILSHSFIVLSNVFNELLIHCLIQ